MDLVDVRLRLDELAILGLVRRSGEIRNGRPVWAITERGRLLMANGWVLWPDGRLFTTAHLEDDALDVHDWARGSRSTN